MTIILLKYKKVSNYFDNVSLDFCHNLISHADLNLKLSFYSNHLMDVFTDTVTSAVFGKL